MKKKSREKKIPHSATRVREMKKHRFFAAAAFFVLVCLAFTITLGVTQCTGVVNTDEDDGLDVRSETVVGERGRIYDRNGVLLVDNESKYDLVFEYGSMAYTSAQVNRALLDCIKILDETDNADKRAEDFFPLGGTYPDMSLLPEAKDANSDIGYYYNRFLVKNAMAANSTADDIVEYFVKEYKLSDKNYSDSEIGELIRLHYDKERIGFGSYQAYTIAEDIDPEDTADAELYRRIKEQRIEGATLIKQKGRVYLYEGYASHILGRIGKITAENVEDYEDYPLDALVGISGIEYAFEEFLRGSDGKRITKYDADGNIVEQSYSPAPKMGNDIYLTIDINLQIAAEDALAEEIESLEHSEAGAFTASIPTTGEVLVIASYPKYGESQFNRALQGTYAPGSTYKIGTALAALEKNYIDEYTQYNCQQHDESAPDCLGLHGDIDVSEAIRVSCNIFFNRVGQEMGIESVAEYTQRLGLGVPTGIELGEKSGNVASESETQTLFNNASAAIGQSTHLYTPMQLSVYMSSIVNGGTRYSAHLLKSVKSRADGSTLLTSEPKVLDTVEFSQHTYDTLISAMGSVVSESAIRTYFSGCGVEVGGKTGTAEKAGQVDNGLFCGFAPLDKPVIVASCIIEEGEAGTNAAKVVAAVFGEYFNPTQKD